MFGHCHMKIQWQWSVRSGPRDASQRKSLACCFSSAGIACLRPTTLLLPEQQNNKALGRTFSTGWAFSCSHVGLVPNLKVSLTNENIFSFFDEEENSSAQSSCSILITWMDQPRDMSISISQYADVHLMSQSGGPMQHQSTYMSQDHSSSSNLLTKVNSFWLCQAGGNGNSSVGGKLDHAWCADLQISAIARVTVNVRSDTIGHPQTMTTGPARPPVAIASIRVCTMSIEGNTCRIASLPACLQHHTHLHMSGRDQTNQSRL
jgi:hypothetical protein